MVVLVCATAALIGIVRFMSSVREGWTVRGETDVPVAVGAPRAGPGDAPPAVARVPPAGATSIGPADGIPADARDVASLTGPAGERGPGAVSTLDAAAGEAGGADVSTADGSIADGSIAVAAALKARRLTLPVAGVRADALVPSFTQARGERTHEARDIMAPAGPAVVAVEDGTVAKLFTSKAGGLTVYHFDPSRSVAYYYAHLQGYAAGLDEGDTLRRGQVIGYVGSTGNANPDAPHLHFAIFRLGPDRRWWEGTAIDPYLVLR